MDENHSIDPIISKAEEGNFHHEEFPNVGDVAAAAVAASTGSDQSHDESIPPVSMNNAGRALSTSKRAAQNRAAQRAFRQRKEQRIKELEAKVQNMDTLKDTIEALRQENIQLRDYILALQSRLIEQPSGVPTPPAVYSGREASLYGVKTGLKNN